jgi:TPR repeat protein
MQRLALHFQVGFKAVSASKFAQVLSCKSFTRNAVRLDGCRDICRRSGTPQPLLLLFATSNFLFQVAFCNMLTSEKVIHQHHYDASFFVTSTSERSCSVSFGSTYLRSLLRIIIAPLILCRRQLAIKSLNRTPAPALAPALAPAPAPALGVPPNLSAPALFEEGQRLYGEQRFSEAVERWGRAALQQHGPSHAHLSDMLIDGRAGVVKDEKRAFELATAGAALGCAHSKGVLGRCYVYGSGVAKDEARGLALGRESAAAGSCFGQFVVGKCYDAGWGVAQDHAEAAPLYSRAAAQGHAGAQNNLGVLYGKGKGVIKILVQAVRLYRLAAVQGDAHAQVNLGGMLETGAGVVRDIVEAIRWYRLAAAQGQAEATSRLRRLRA